MAHTQHSSIYQDLSPGTSQNQLTQLIIMKKGILKQDYYDLLEALKFNWNPTPSGGLGKPKDDIWLQHYQKLVLYKNLFGTTNVSQTNKEYKALGKWVNDQRHHYKKGRMSDFRINKLNDIDFVWVAKKTISATG